MVSYRIMKEQIAKRRMVIKPLDSASVQISSLRLTSPVERLYGSTGLGSKYQGQAGPTATRYYQEFTKGR